MQKYESVQNALEFRESFMEVFIEDQYRWLYNKIRPNTTLVDLGAHMGDTAFYFAQNENVRKIYAYEPLERYYKEALRLLKHSTYAGRITFYNRGVTANGGESTPTAYHEGKSTPSISIQKALYGLKNIAIKCDIEGAEKGLFDNSNMEEVYALQMETHHNCHRNVADVLKKHGFKVDIKTPFGPKMIYAKRGK